MASLSLLKKSLGGVMNDDERDALYIEYQNKLRSIEDDREKYQKEKRDLDNEREEFAHIYKEDMETLGIYENDWKGSEELNKLRHNIEGFLDLYKRELDKKEEDLEEKYREIIRKERDIEENYINTMKDKED